LEAGGLEGIAAEHEEAEGGSCEQFFPFEGAEDMRAKDSHQESSDSEARGQKNEDGGVDEGVFYDDKGSTPEEGTEGQSEVGAKASGHAERLKEADGKWTGKKS